MYYKLKSNKKNKQQNKSSIFKSVYYDKNNKNQRTQIRIENKAYYLSNYNFEISVVIIYNFFAYKVFKQFVKLNKVNKEVYNAKLTEKLLKLCNKHKL